MSNEAEKDEFYKKDPKKYLKDFFEREGLEMYFDTNQLACEFVYLFVYLLLLLLLFVRIGFTVRIKYSCLRFSGASLSPY